MSKGDYPALRMIVEGNRLVPAGQFDAERLNSYRRGTVVFCRFTEEKDRVLVRKWFAVIGLVLKQCQTPWKNKNEAHEAKLALGIVNLSKTVSGQWMQYPKSLSELDDPEMSDAIEQMIALLSSMTGVDVETLRKETAHIDGQNTPSKPAPSPAVSDAGEPARSLDEAEASTAPETDAPASNDDCADLLARYAQSILHKAGYGASGTEIAEVKNRWAKEFDGFHADVLEKVEHITNEARRVFNGKTQYAEAVDNVVGLIGVDVSMIRGA